MRKRGRYANSSGLHKQGTPKADSQKMQQLQPPAEHAQTGQLRADLAAAKMSVKAANAAKAHLEAM